ncbi:MAG: amidohydrolase family protein [Myxococcota bacterium]
MAPRLPLRTLLAVGLAPPTIACKVPNVATDPSDDPTVEHAIRLDAHAHIVSPTLLKANGGDSDGDGPASSAQQYVDDFMRASGSQRAQVLSSAYMWSSPALQGDDYDAELAAVQQENDFVVAQSALFPDQLVPFCSVNPTRGYALDEIDRCLTEYGVRGLKMHFSNSQIDLTDGDQLADVQAVIWHAAAQGVSVVVHFADLSALSGDDTDAAQQDAQAAMNIFLTKVLADDRATGLHLTFAHLTGAGNFPSWTQATLSGLIGADQQGIFADDVSLFVDVSAVFDRDDLGTLSPGVTNEDLQNMGLLLEMWGMDRVVWGSDNNPDYLTPTWDMWPLSPADYDTMASADGSAFLQ